MSRPRGGGARADERPGEAGRPDPAERRERLVTVGLVVLALVGSLGLTLQGWSAARSALARDEESDFGFHAREAEARVRQRLLAYEQVLRGAAALFDASSSVERGEFRTYVSLLRLWESYPGIQGVGFSRLVPAAELAAHEAAVRREGFPEYRIRPPETRDPYSSIVYLEPFEGRNLRAFGYDMYSEPVRREAMDRARDTGRAALSGKVTLVQETEQDIQAGTLLYLPVYRHGAPLDTVAERRAALVGWAYAPFRMRDLMLGCLGAEAQGLDVELHDGEGLEPASLLFDSAAPRYGGRPGQSMLESIRPLEIAGRRWTLAVREQPRPPVPWLKSRPSLIAMAGGSASLALALLVGSLGAARTRALAGARAARRDLEERRRAAEALEGARRVAQATLDAMPERICVLDGAGVVVSVNRTWRDHGGPDGVAGAVPDGLLEGARYLEACERAAAAGDEGAGAFAAQLRELLDGRRRGFTHDYQARAADERRWFVARATRFDEGGQARALVVHGDVTERRHAEEAAREAEERLRLANAAAGQVEWDEDLATGRGAIGSGWSRLTGRVETPPDQQRYLELVHPADREALEARYRDCREGRAYRVDQEHRLSVAGGGWRWMRIRGQVTARDAAGRPLRLAGTIADVDEVHALQERLLAATRLASVGTLAAGVAHEINNPLAWIHGNLGLGLELLRAAEPPGAPPLDRGELALLLREALEGSDRIAGIVRAMRSLGRPERLDALRPVDVRGEIIHAAQLVRNQVQQRARLELQLPEGLPFVLARTSELGRVFLNLLLNAAQAIEPGRPEAHLVRVWARQVGAELVVDVSDTGPGVPPEVRERIFEPFFSTKAVGQGTGLGLSIARSIVDAAGGALELQTGDERGATFRVHLPVAPGTAVPAAQSPLHVEAQAEAQAAGKAGERIGEERDEAGAGGLAPGAHPPLPPGERGGGEGPPTSPPTRRRVLIVDDEPLVVRVMGRVLERAHEVTVLDSAAEALRRLDAGERWDAMLVDLMMPGVDGVAFHAALAARHPGLLPRLALVTGGAFGERATGFLARTEVTVLAKPIEPARLLETVEQLATTALPTATPTVAVQA